MPKFRLVSDAATPRAHVSHAATPRAHLSPTPFVCRQNGEGMGAAWIYVAGELDLATVPELARTLRQAQQDALLVVLDLRELTFVDSAGVHAIVSAAIRFRGAGGRMIAVRGPAQVDSVFALIGVTEDIEIFDLNPADPPVQALLQLGPDPA